MSERKRRGTKNVGLSARLRDFRKGEIYHIYQRGNHGKRTFHDAGARIEYVGRMFTLARENLVRVHTFCLMANHVHLVLEETKVGGISKMMQELQQVHARGHNRRLRKGGNLWEQHFCCRPVNTEAYYQTVMRYVENNPVVNRRAPTAVDYRWSGALAHARNEQVEISDGKAVVKTELYLEGWRGRFGEAVTSNWVRFLMGRYVNEALLEEVQAIVDGRKRQALAQKLRAGRRQKSVRTAGDFARGGEAGAGADQAVLRSAAPEEAVCIGGEELREEGAWKRGRKSRAKREKGSLRFGGKEKSQPKRRAAGQEHSSIEHSSIERKAVDGTKAIPTEPAEVCKMARSAQRRMGVKQQGLTRRKGPAAGVEPEVPDPPNETKSTG